MAGTEIACTSCAGTVKLPRMATAKLTKKADSIPEVRDGAAIFELNPSASATAVVGDGDQREEKDEDDIPAAIVDEELDDIPAVVIDEDDDGGATQQGEHSVVVTVELPSAPTDGVDYVEKNGATLTTSSTTEEQLPKKVPMRKRPAPRKPLTVSVKEKRKGVMIGNNVDKLIPEPRVKPGDMGSPGDFRLKEPTPKEAKELKLRPVLMKAAQHEAAKEFRGFKGKSSGSESSESVSPGKAAPIRVRPRSKIGQILGRAKEFILSDPRARRGPAPEDARDHTLKQKYTLKLPTEKDAQTVDVRPIARRGDEEVSGLHDALEKYVHLHDFSEMEGFGEMSKEEQKAILEAQAELERSRVRSTNLRVFFSGVIFAAPALIAVGVLSFHALKAASDPTTNGTSVLPGKEKPNFARDGVLPKDVVSAYAKVNAAESVEQLAELTRDPDRTLPKMRKYYQRVAFIPNFLRGLRTGAMGEIEMPHSEFYWLIAEDGNEEDRMLAFERTEDGLKFDWESFVHYSERSWDEFLGTQPRDAEDYRVSFALNDYFVGQFWDDRNWLCFRLEHPVDTGVCYAYAQRNSPVASMLNSLLRGQAEEEAIAMAKASAKAILSLRFSGTPGDFPQATIDGVVCSGWVKP